MFTVAILIGIYSYLIFSLGLVGYLYKQNIIFVTLIYLLLIFLFHKKLLFKVSGGFKYLINWNRKSKLVFGLVTLIFLQAIVNLVGVLGPELGFDALWYHLTLPKIYLQNHSVMHIPGGLLYYSDMPKLIEMIYVAGLSLGSEIFAKLLSFSFGILTLIALYKVSRKFFSRIFSLCVVVLFYSNLVVGWMSITSYIDLARTFFELMAFWGFLEWVESKDKKWLIEGSIMLGLAISTKLLALGSLFIFTVLLIFFFRRITNILTYWLFALLVPLPWFIFSFVHTGNPFYPAFSSLYNVPFDLNLLNPIKFFHSLWIVFTQASDRISPFYLILLPSAFFFKKAGINLKLLILYSCLGLFVWYLTPRTGGGRFLLPYLPAFSILAVLVINRLKNIIAQKVLIAIIIFISMFSILYRFTANMKYVPVLFGKESRSDFLVKNLNFSFGDFYDIDNYFKKNITAQDNVLLYGFHNLYYVNFPFIDSSWVKSGDAFNYIAVQNTTIPKRFSRWNLIYYNSKTNVKLYSLDKIKWVY